MTDVDRLLADYIDRRNDGVEAVSVAELDQLAVARPLTELEPLDARPPRLRTWLAAAAVVALIALAGGAAAVLLSDDPPVADDSGGSSATARLLDLVPVTGPGEFVTWVDVAATRDVLGVEPPAADSSGATARDHLEELQGVYDEMRVGTGWPAQTSADAVDWWRQLGIDIARVDGWARWGGHDAQLVAVGPFDSDAIDMAIRHNDWTGHLAIGEHRGVTIYSWGEDLGTNTEAMVAGEFPDPFSLRIAVIDDVVVMSRTTADLHELIDQALDGGPSLLSAVLTLDDLRVLDDGSLLGGTIWAPASTRDRGHLELDTVDLQTGAASPLLALLLVSGQSADAVVAEVQPQLDDLVERQDGAWADDVRVTAETRAGVVVVQVEGLDVDASVDAAREVFDFRQQVKTTVFPELADLFLPSQPAN